MHSPFFFALTNKVEIGIIFIKEKEREDLISV